MRKAVRLSAFLAILATAAFAETWSGKLVDANCATQAKSGASSQSSAESSCTPTASTTAFAIKTGSKVLKLDDAGNTKAADALKTRENGANRSKSENAEMTATVKGTLSGDTIQVQSIDVH